jgi:hypothetical protein
MEVLQCPACPLRFRLPAELEDHLKLEHPDFHVEEDPTRGSPLDEARRRRNKRSPNE